MTTTEQSRERLPSALATVLGRAFAVLGRPFAVLGRPFAVLGRPFAQLARYMRAESPRRRRLWIAVVAALTLVPVALNAARPSRYTATINLFPSFEAPRTTHANVALVRSLLGDPVVRTAARNEFGLAARPRSIAGVDVKPAILVTHGQPQRVRVYRLSARASTPARAKKLVDFLAVRAINVSAVRAAKRAGSELDRLDTRLRSTRLSVSDRTRLSRQRPVLTRITIRKPSRYVLGDRAPEPRLTRLADKAIDALPGRFPARRNPLLAGLAGLVLGAVLWLIALSVPRWAPRRDVTTD